MKERKLKSITIVAPFYNEETNILEFYQQVTKELQKLKIHYDLIFVDDGSKDKTLHILNELADRDPVVSVLSLSRNFGHQAALTAGLDYATGEAIVVMDSDLQHPPHVIAEMIDGYEKGADVVHGVRKETNRLGFLKRATTKLWYTVFRFIANVQAVPGAADFRLMSKPVVKNLLEMRESHRYLRGMVPWLGFRSDIIHYEQPNRLTGKPKYSWRKSFRLARHGLLSFSTIPLEIISYIGFLMVGLAFIYLVYVIVTALLGNAVTGWASVIAMVLILGGVQLISIGVVAQYVGMIFEEVKQRPLYVLKHKRLSQTANEKQE
jgi:dolichol-phosphate mannosyltransferase